jgi:hypothetical protein
LPAGLYTLTVTSALVHDADNLALDGDRSGFAGGDAVSAPILVGPPFIRRLVVNNSSRQRATVTRLVVKFSERVTADANAFELRRADGLVIPLAVRLRNAGGSTTATLTFQGGDLDRGSLPDGQYTLVIKAGGIHDRDGIALDGNRDGAAGDDFTFTFFRLAGDRNGDGVLSDAERRSMR